MKRNSFFTRFLVRWLVSSLGLWIAAALLGAEHLSVGGRWGAWVAAGFFLALVNMFFKPLLVFLSIPVLLVTLGLFLIVVNGFLILLASWIYKPLEVNGLGVAMVAGVIVSLVNFLVTQVLEDFSKE
jgi:putative membrane protein